MTGSDRTVGAITLANAIIEIEKTIRDRCRTYPDLVGRGRLLQATSDHKNGCLRKAHDALLFLEKHEVWIRDEYRRRVDAMRCDAAAAEDTAGDNSQPSTAGDQP